MTEIKPRYELIPPAPLAQMAQVFAYGADKYAPWDWLERTSPDENYGALMRHLIAHRSGESLDPESGLPHLAHAMARLAMMMAGPSDSAPAPTPPSTSLYEMMVTGPSWKGKYEGILNMAPYRHKRG